MDTISLKTVKFGKDRSREQTLNKFSLTCGTYAELTEAFDVFDLSGDNTISPR